MKLTQRLFLTLGLLTAFASLAGAHAFLDYSDPKVGSTVKGSPAVVKIWFTRKLKGASNKIEVFDAKGSEVDRKDVKVDPADKNLMTVSVRTLPTGTYKVVWNAVCTDTHHTTGTFTFEVTN